MSGGDGTVSDLFAHMKGGQKRGLLGMIERGMPDVYRRVRASLLLFEDLKSLDDNALRLLCSEVRIEVLATALSGLGQGDVDRFMDVLPRNARATVTQFLDLRSGSLSPDEIDRAQSEVLVVAERLDRDGRIQLPRSRRVGS